MLTPVNASLLGSSQARPGTPSLVASTGSFSSNGPQADTGPAQIRAETSRAIDAAKQPQLTQRIRVNETRDGSASSGDLPAGPPPAFKETLLERQSRTAFDAPEGVAANDPQGNAANLLGAEAAFAEMRALTPPAPEPGLSRKY